MVQVHCAAQPRQSWGRIQDSTKQWQLSWWGTDYKAERGMGNVLLLDWSGCYTSMSICGKPQTQALGFVYFIT